MSINIVDVILYSILALSVISGMYKGFITSGLAMVGFGAAWFGALNLFPKLAELALSNKAFMGMLSYYLDPSSLFKTSTLASTPVANLISNTGTGSTLLNQAMQELNLPQAIETAFKNNVSNQLFASLNLTTLSDYLGQTIWVAAVFDPFAWAGLSTALTNVALQSASLERRNLYLALYWMAYAVGSVLGALLGGALGSLGIGPSPYHLPILASVALRLIGVFYLSWRIRRNLLIEAEAQARAQALQLP